MTKCIYLNEKRATLLWTKYSSKNFNGTNTDGSFTRLFRTCSRVPGIKSDSYRFRII